MSLDTQNTIRWWQSPSIWGGIVAVLAPAIGALFKVEIDSAMQQQIVDALVNVATTIGALVAIHGRLTANKKITSKKQEEK